MQSSNANFRSGASITVIILHKGEGDTAMDTTLLKILPFLLEPMSVV